MQTIQREEIPKIYSAYSKLLYTGEDGRRGQKGPRYIRERYYLCECCGTEFRVEHYPRNILGLYGYGYGEMAIFCPHCGHMHSDTSKVHTVYHFDDEEGAVEKAPRRMTLSLIEGKGLVLLRVSADTVAIRHSKADGGEEGKLLTIYGHHVEEFRFDVRRRVTTFRVRTGSARATVTERELGDPFDKEVFRASVLRCLDPYTLAREYKPRWLSLLRNFRALLRSKWQESHGYDLGGLHVSTDGTHNGQVLFTLQNAAFRLVYPDAKNLPGTLNCGPHGVDGFLGLMLADSETRALYKESSFPRIRAAHDSATGVAEVFGLPPVPSVRKALRENVFAAPELRLAFKAAGGNVDCALRVFRALRNGLGCTRQGVYDFLARVSAHCAPAEVAHYAETSELREIFDAARMFDDLPRARREEAMSVRLPRLHDWLVAATERLRSEDFDLEVPEHVRRRLQMQLNAGSANFFLPGRAAELEEGSQIFHNCVKTYKGRVLRGDCYIVYMTDDAGKLMACLEVRGAALVQAKLRYNREVKTDARVNGAVLDWCRAKGLSVATRDVQEVLPPALILEARMVV